MKATEVNTADVKKLPWHAHAIAAWPLAMVTLGGLVGGVCGGLAYWISISLINKKGISAATYILSALVGIGSVGLYFVIAIALAQLLN